jgi:hypothetical protein
MQKTLQEIQAENRKLMAIRDIEKVLFLVGNGIPIVVPRAHNCCWMPCKDNKQLFIFEFILDNNKCYKFSYDLTKETLEEQSEETQRAINQLLTQ